MSQLVVVKDRDVFNLLINLDRDSVQAFHRDIQTCLKQFSTTNEGRYQPAPGVVNRPNGQKTLFRPFTSPTHVGTKIVVDPAPTNGIRHPLHGILVVCDKDGLPRGVVNAEEVTAYRTALSALIPWSKRTRTRRIVVFGAGKVALWHVRLCLTLRGSEIDHISIINRSMERAQTLVDTVIEENRARWKSSAKVTVLDPSDHIALQEILGHADVICCTVPSKVKLFSKADLPQWNSDRPPLITAIGSWQPDMIEVDVDLIRVAVADSRGCKLRRTGSGGAIIVDDRTSCVSHAGEIVQSGLGADDVVEIGEILHAIDDASMDDEKHKKLKHWLADGFVVYKSVGVSVTDLVAGNKIISLAQEKNLGTTIDDF